jgi:hypothetical protein
MAVSIIVMVLSSLGRARESARRVNGGSNLRQVGAGSLVPANENNNSFPCAANYNTNGNFSDWIPWELSFVQNNQKVLPGSQRSTDSKISSAAVRRNIVAMDERAQFESRIFAHSKYRRSADEFRGGCRPAPAVLTIS